MSCCTAITVCSISGSRSAASARRCRSAAARSASRGPARARLSRPGTSLRVQRLDLVVVLLVDRLALELHRRRQLVAAGLPIARDEVELLDLLDPGELL